MRGREQFVRRMVPVVILALFAGAGAAAAGEAGPVAALLDAAGAASIQPTYLRIGIAEEETAPGGKTTDRATTLWVRFPQLDPVRLELGHGVVLVRKAGDAWAVVNGKQDKRPQSAMMAKGTQNEKLFPFLLPFSLGLPGVHVEAVGRTTFEGASVDRFTVRFEHGFFGTPVMNAEWTLLADPESHRIVAASFVPAAELRNIVGEGVRYRYLRWTKAAGAELPQTVVVEGFDPQRGTASGHVNVVKLTYRENPSPPVTLFVSPDELEKLEEE